MLEDFADAGPLVLAASVSLHVGKHAALVGPEVVPGPEEEDGELSDLVSQVLDVGGDVSGMVDLRGPPPEEDTPQLSRADSEPSGRKTFTSSPPPVFAQLHPDDVSVFGLLPGSAVVAEPAPVGHGDVEAVGVKGRGARLAAQQLPPWKQQNRVKASPSRRPRSEEETHPPLEQTKHQLTLTWLWCLYALLALKWLVQIMAVLVTISLPAATHRSPAWYATGQRRQRISLPTGERGR